nr:regulating synaptic membrane exocytosis protein 2-like [Lytechinus pictus]
MASPQSMSKPAAAPTPGPSPPGPTMPAAPSTPVLPDLDLSHLTEEERQQIMAVLDRQKNEEEKEAKLIRSLQDDISKAEQTVKVITEENKVKNMQQNGAVCQICHKTKFADGVGHSCNYCNLKSCARCGGRVTLRSNKC